MSVTETVPELVTRLMRERDELRLGMDFLKEEAAHLRGERDMLKTTARWSVPLGKAEESLKCIVEKLLWDLSMPTEYIEGKRDEALAAFREASKPMHGPNRSSQSLGGSSRKNSVRG